jgi:CubicO group peptidase (beta-lactamase class C family)
VVTGTDGAGPPVGSYGWIGGYGTNFVADPHSATIALLLTQRLMTGADDVAIATKLRRVVFPATIKGENRP